MDRSEPSSFPNLTRRSWLQVAGLAAVGGSLADRPDRVAADDVDTEPANAPGDVAKLPQFNRFPRDVQEYYVRRIREVEREANARRAALTTRADAERYVSDVRERIRQCFAPFPEKAPLNSRVTAVHDRTGFRIENVIFDSRPSFPVTANLYVPTGREGPRPGVVIPCGHSATGKAGSTYQAAALGLVRQGYVVLVFDPMGQGERLQHVTADFKAQFGVGTSEHTYIGNRMTLVGESLPSWFAWDGIRALDYLLSRPEVDARHVGVTGNSGGGTQTAWLCGVEPRFTMAAPGCFITTLRRNIENEHSQDPEQFPWHLLALGLDHSDLLAAMAPRPVLLMGQEKDYFDARGFEEAAARLRRLYELLGAPENSRAFLGADYHGLSRPMREAMFAWFNRHTGTAEGAGQEPAARAERPATLQCTKSGQVAELKPATEFSIDAELSKRLAASRPALAGDALRQAIQSVLKLPARPDIADYRILQEAAARGYPKRAFAAYAVETEPGIHAVVYRLSETQLLSRVPRGSARALLYVSHRSADLELRKDPWLKQLIAAEPQAAVFACDLRGVGESQPSVLTTPSNPAKGGTDYFHAGLGLMFDSPMPGQRTHDLLRVLDWLHENGHREIHVAARGFGAIPATFAAVLHDTVTQVTLKQALGSYGEVAESERYKWPLSSLVPGILRSFDLPDCYRALERKGLKQIEPVSAEGVPD